MKKRYKVLGWLFGVLGVLVVGLAVALSYTKECGPAPALADGTASMTAVVGRCYGSPEVLEIGAVAVPEVGANDVLVKVKAASVNPLDWHYMRGTPYVMRLASGIGTPNDARVGVDFAGVVERVGDSVTQFRPGDEVFGGRSGAFAEYVVVPEDRALAHKPEGVSFEQVAAMPIAAITALQALRDKARVEAGDRVLINGASGGVGTYAVQLAKAMGAEVTGVCSTRNVDLVRSLGADHVFDYKKEDFTKSGQQWDVVIDNVGNHSVFKYDELLAADGRLVMVGGQKGNWLAPFVNPVKAMVMSPFVSQELITILAVLSPDDLATLADYAASGELRSVIDKRYTLDTVPDAIRYSESGRARGKIIVSL